MNSSINNNVNLGGEQRISGVKYFLQNICRKLSVAFNSTPSSNIYSGYTIKDVDNNMLASFQGIKYTTGTNKVQMEVIGNSGVAHQMYIQENREGGVTYSYGQTQGDNWIKLPKSSGRALLICWGQATLKTGDVVTFPTPFRITPAVNVSMLSGTNYGFPAYASSVTTTNFTAKRNDSNDVPTMWVAVGVAEL